MKIATRFLLGALAFATSPSLLAQSPPDFESLNDRQLSERFDEALARDPRNFCEEVSPLLDEMLKRPAFSHFSNSQKLAADYQCAVANENWTNAHAVMIKLEIQSGRNLGAAGFYVSWYAEKYVDAAKRLQSLAIASDGAQLRQLADDEYYYFFRDLDERNQHELALSTALALADSPNAASFSPDITSFVAKTIVEGEARNGRFDRSVELLKRLREPSTITTFLSVRRFEPIWPAIERYAGENLATVINDRLAADRARFDADKNDRKAFQQLAHSLHFAGKFEDVVVHVSSFGESAEAIQQATSEDAWALNIKAYALDVLGRESEAEALFDHLATIPYDSESNGWLVNFAINRASRLVELGKLEKGLQAANLAEQIASNSGSPYAKMLVRRDKICALEGLGRKSEANAIVGLVVENRKDSYAAAATAMLCVGQPDSAAQFVIEALEDPSAADDMANTLQSQGFQLFYTQSLLPTLRAALLERPDVRAAYARVARDIPDQFVPLAGKRRAELTSEKQ
jgi:hypothetical protein